MTQNTDKNNALEVKVSEMIAGTREVPGSLRPLAETYRKLDEYLVDPKRLAAELNRSLVALVKTAEAAEIEVPVSVLLTAEEVPADLRAAMASHVRLHAYYVDPSKLEADCNQLFDAMVAAVNMMESFANLATILIATPVPAKVAPTQIHGVPARRKVV